MAIMDAHNRRSILKAIRSAGLISVLPETGRDLLIGEARVLQETAEPGMDAQAKPKYSLKFAVIGLDRRREQRIQVFRFWSQASQVLHPLEIANRWHAGHIGLASARVGRRLSRGSYERAKVLERVAK